MSEYTMVKVTLGRGKVHAARKYEGFTPYPICGGNRASERYHETTQYDVDCLKCLKALPATEAPATEAPATEAPTAETPTAETPATETVAAETLAAETLTAETVTVHIDHTGPGVVIALVTGGHGFAKSPQMYIYRDGRRWYGCDDYDDRYILANGRTARVVVQRWLTELGLDHKRVAFNEDYEY